MNENNSPEQIYQAAKANLLLFGSRREMRRLKQYLNRDEEVFEIITGSPIMGRGRGIVAATSERVIFIRDGWVYRDSQDFPYETVSSVEFKIGIFFGTFSMYGKGDEVGYNWVGRIAGARFAKTVRELVAKSSNNPTRTRPESAPIINVEPALASVPNTTVEEIKITEPHNPDSVAPIGDDANRTVSEKIILDEATRQDLEELKTLKQKGLITEEEYYFKRQNLIDNA